MKTKTFEIDSMDLTPFHIDELSCRLEEKECDGGQTTTLVYKGFACTCSDVDTEAYRAGLAALLEKEKLERDGFTTAMVHMMTSLDINLSFASDMWCGIYAEGRGITFRIECDFIDYGLVLLYHSVKAVLGTTDDDVVSTAKIGELLQQAKEKAQEATP